MFCGQCGKRVMENMLFCPFCGSPIVIPDQDGNAPQHNGEAVPPKAADAPLEPENRQAEPEDAPSEDVQETPKTEATSPRSLFSDEPEIEQRAEDADPIEEFVPLSFDFDAPAEDAQPNSPEPERTDAPERSGAVSGNAGIVSRRGFAPVGDYRNRAGRLQPNRR